MESVSRREGMRPSAVLAIVGGALMLAGGMITLSVFGIWAQSGMGTSMMQDWQGNGGGWMMGGGGGWGRMMSSPGAFTPQVVGTLSAISVGAGAVSVAGGYAIHKRPESAGIWGTGILIASIIGLVGMSGFFVGPIVGIIGGILALVGK
jgi:hypothetical protein